MSSEFCGPSSIPDEVLTKIVEHRPHLSGIVRNCRRSDCGRRFDKPLADAYLVGESRLNVEQIWKLSACCAGHRYGQSARNSRDDDARPVSEDDTLPLEV